MRSSVIIRTKPSATSQDRESKLSNSVQILLRLRKIEGQIKGLQRMIDEKRGCADIVNQIIAARHALDGTMIQILHEHIYSCVLGVTDRQRTKKSLDELFQIIERVIK